MVAFEAIDQPFYYNSLISLMKDTREEKMDHWWLIEEVRGSSLSRPYRIYHCRHASKIRL